MTDEGGAWGPLAIQTLTRMHIGESTPRTAALESLVDLDVKEWDDEMSSKFIAELGNLHNPDKVKALDIKPEEVPLLKKTLLESQIHVDERRIVSFSRVGISAIRRAQRCNQSPEITLRQSMETWQEEQEWMEPSPALSAENDAPIARLLIAVEKALRDAVVAADADTKALLAEAGDVRPTTLHEVIARYAEDLTRDGFKQTVSELYWLIQLQTAHSEGRLIETIRHIISVMEPIMPKLRAIEAGELIPSSLYCLKFECG